MERYCNNLPPHRLTQHKRFVPDGTHPNPAFSGTSFMLEPLSEIPNPAIEGEKHE